MPSPRVWYEVLNGKTFIINVDKDVERYNICSERVSAAGFTNVERWKAIDGEDDKFEITVADEWAAHGSPKFNENDAVFLNERRKQAKTLSHLNLLKHIIDNNIEWATIFEDDVLFHKDWHKLAEQYFGATPQSYGICYIGNHYICDKPYNILRIPVLSTHAMIITLEGAKLLYKSMTHDRNGIYTLDYMINHYMVTSLIYNTPRMCNWYMWNGGGFPDKTATKHPERGFIDNGLVFQDYTLSKSRDTNISANTHSNAPKPRVLVVVMSCNKYKDLWKPILDKNIKDLIILVGNEGMHNRILSRHELVAHKEPQLYGQILHLGCNDCYEGLPIKIIKMIDFVLNSPQFKDVTHILKLDDHDTVFNKEAIDKLHELPEILLGTHDYIGQRMHIGDGIRNYHQYNVSLNSIWKNKWYEGAVVPWLHGGSSYILSRKAMQLINREYNIENISYVENNEIFEDVMIAKLLHKNNIYPKEINYGIVGDK